jgi:hypothetical protein
MDLAQAMQIAENIWGSMDLVFPNLSDETLSAIADDINQRGFGVAKACIPLENLTDLREFVKKGVADAGNEYVVYTGLKAVQGTILEKMATSPEFIRACKTIYEKGTGKKAPNVPLYQVLRCLAGRTQAKHAYLFHYDSYVLTALVPVIIPVEGQEGMLGDFIFFPNTRKTRTSYLLNLVDKVLLDNKITQIILKWLVRSDLIKYDKLKFVPGNVYFFWGCRSIHANEPCEQNKIRSTAIFHFVDPNSESWLRKKLRKKTIQPQYPT